MFYLNHFFQILKGNPARALLFLVLSASLFFLAGHRDFIKKTVGMSTTTQLTNPYFHALISSKQNSGWIARKLRELPGVDRVEVLPAEELSKQVQELLSGMDAEVMQAVGAIELSGLKVVTKLELEERSIGLIKDYLTRLAGSDTTVGATVQPAKATLKKSISWQDYIAEIVIAIAFFCWSASVILMMRPIRRSSYLIEQFQRRRNVALKTWSVAALFSIAVGLIATFAWQPPEYMPVAICLIIAMLSTLLHAKRTSWEG